VQDRELTIEGRELKFELAPYPKQVVIETTTACNQRCKMCAHTKMTRPKGRMDLKLYLDIVTEIGSWPTGRDTEVWLTFYGDAVLLGPRLCYLIELAHTMGCHNLILNTNGEMLTEDMANMLAATSLRRLIFSIDAVQPETYKLLRGGDLDRVVENVMRVCRSPTRRVPEVIVQFSVMPENRDELPGFVAFWGRRGLLVKARTKLTWTGAVEAPGLEFATERLPCCWALSTAAITWDGRLVACACDYDARYVLGVVGKDGSLRDLWQGPHRAFRQIHLDHRWGDLPEVCRWCRDWKAVGTRELWWDPEWVVRSLVTTRAK
jgi:pyruvate-formate lyase-activating enzyme